jgi:general secretion pathway protein K
MTEEGFPMGRVMTRAKQLGVISSRRMKTESGIVLLMVLWALILLSVISSEFCYSMRSGVNMTRNFKEDVQAYYYARAGISVAIHDLLVQYKKPTGAAAEQAIDADGGRVPLRINKNNPPFRFQDGFIQVKMENEAGKVNLNRADQRLLKILFQTFGMKDSEMNGAANSIMDWRDKDNLHRLSGAENDYYEHLTPSYYCKNNDFDAVGELLLVRWISPAIYYGGLKEMVSVCDDPLADKLEARSPIQEYVTLQKRNQNPMQEYLTLQNTAYIKAGNGTDYNKIDINSAPPRLLLSLPGMTEDLLNKVLGFRKKNDFTSIAQLIPLVGNEVYVKLYSYVAVQKSPYTTITATAWLDGSRVTHTVRALVYFDQTLPTGYRVAGWWDSVSDDDASQVQESQEFKAGS